MGRLPGFVLLLLLLPIWGCGSGADADLKGLSRREATPTPPRRWRGAPPGPTDEALAWLAARQRADGGWRDGPPDEAGDADALALSGQVLLRFLGACITSRGDVSVLGEDLSSAVRRGMVFLKRRQGEDGRFRPAKVPGEGARGALLDHVVATRAMVEVYGLTESLIYRGSARRGMEALASACQGGDVQLRSPEVVASTLMALLSAHHIDRDFVKRGKKPPLGIDLRRFESLRAWRTPASALKGLDVACAILARLVFEGNDTEEARRDLRRLAHPILQQPFTWTTRGVFGDPADWARLNFALEAVGGKAAAAWQKAARRHVLEMQEGRERDGALRGSWDPGGLPGARDGRIHLTAHCLGVLWYSRYAMLIIESPR